MICLLPLAAMVGFAEEVPELFAQGRYEAAELALGTSSDAQEPPWVSLYWEIRLAQDPARALSVLRSLLATPDLPEPLQIGLALEEASLQFARGAYRAALEPLEALISHHSRTLPGEIYLVAGLAWWALRNVQESRKAFASVLPSDASFPWARYYLGRIGLETGEVALALRYFSSADKGELADRLPALAAGRWEGLRRTGREEEAEALFNQLQQEHPHCLELMRIREIRGAQETVPTAAAWVETSRVGQDPDNQADDSGHLTLQLGAFADRSRALSFWNRWQGEMPNLRLDEESGPDGQILYKVRAGWFVDRAQARTEAQRLRRLHGLEVLLVEIDS